MGTKASSSHSNNAVVPENESENTGLSGLAIIHTLPFKDQVQYFSDFLRAAAEKGNQTYPLMIKNKTERQCFWRRSKKFYWDDKDKVLLHRVLIKNIGKFMYNTIIFNVHAIFWEYNDLIIKSVQLYAQKIFQV